jgi:uncharacterized protein (DUF697 family)
MSTRIDNPEEPNRESAAEAVIKHHMVMAMAGGAIPLPWLDLVAITAVQLDMLKGLAKAYDVQLDAASARVFVTSVTSTLVGSALARLGASAVKIIPGIGTVAGGVTQVVVTGGSTYAMGTLLRRMFRNGERLEDVSFGRVKEEVQRYYAVGLEIARWLKTRKPR